MKTSRCIAIAFTALVAMSGSAFAQASLPAANERGAAPKPQSPPELNADGEGGFRIEFLGQEPSADWARAASMLVDKKLIPLETLSLPRGDDPCLAVLKQLGFQSVGLGCSVEMRRLVEKLNPGLATSRAPTFNLQYPKLPIDGTVTWYAGFDRSLPGEADRYQKVTEAWKSLKIGEKSNGPQVQVEFRGFRSSLPPAKSTDYAITLPDVSDIERYDSRLQGFDTRVMSLSTNPLLKPFSMTSDPVGSGKLCQSQSPPPPPLPAYISLLGGTTDDLKCVTKCVASDNCPEIVLIDQAVAPHPDIAPALHATPASGTPHWCPLSTFDENKHHGTHMAGIMVGAGQNAFLGLAPTALLDSKDIGIYFDQNISTIVKSKSLFYARSNVIFVFASQFPGSKESLIGSNLRFSTPRYVTDILSGLRLWVVAAGQRSDQQPSAMEIGPQTNASPMNLGDRGTVLVVTSCDDCYTDHPSISPWANYSGRSSGGLVNLAAPGGSGAEEIPAPITGLEHGLAYGTSQATALVGGLAAAMTACFPQAYNGASLKTRLQTTARPPLSQDVAQKVSGGIVDAKQAMLDPNVHWVTRKSTAAQQNFPEIKWCTETIAINDLDDAETSRNVDVRMIRRIKHIRTPELMDSWFVFYQRDTSIAQNVYPGTIAADPDSLSRLLYFRRGPGTMSEPPVPLSDIEDLQIGMPPRATVEVPPQLVGCKS